MPLITIYMHPHNHDHDKYKPKWYITVAILIVSVLLIFVAVNRTQESTQDQTDQLFTGKIIKILSEKEIDKNDITYVGATKEQELLVETTIKGQKRTITVVNNFSTAQEGEEIILRASLFETGDESFEIIDFVRAKGLFWLAIFFVLLILLVSGKKGLNALIGLVFSFAIILSFIFPQILNGRNPIIIGLVGSILILIVALYVTYGYNKKSLSALLGIAITLLFVSLLANFTVQALHFTGFAGEEAAFLKMENNNAINMVGLVIAGIMIAAIGVLDDIAITQAATVFEFFATDPSLTRWQLYRKAMKIGKDHISAVVNTLVLAYTGASLPLLLLFTLRPWPAVYNISNELIAEEIVRTLVSSSGLILAVPLTTLIAIGFVRRQNLKEKLQ